MRSGEGMADMQTPKYRQDDSMMASHVMEDSILRSSLAPGCVLRVLISDFFRSTFYQFLENPLGANFRVINSLKVSFKKGPTLVKLLPVL